VSLGLYPYIDPHYCFTTLRAIALPTLFKGLRDYARSQITGYDLTSDFMFLPFRRAHMALVVHPTNWNLRYCSFWIGPFGL